MRPPNTAKPAPRRFSVKATPVSDGPGVWQSADVSVFDGERKVGEYHRNMAGWAESTFEPFELNGRWYALYAPDYTSTRLLSLPDCADLGGEDHHADGFCPVEFWVPRFRPVTWVSLESGDKGQSRLFETEADAHSEAVKERGSGRWRVREEYGGWECLDIGFVAGCIWGDDSSWKVQAIDLSRAADGVIARSERFGYLQLPCGKTLPQSISLEFSERTGTTWATIIEQRTWDVRTGALLDPFE